jgi:hypothetical protein
MRTLRRWRIVFTRTPSQVQSAISS